MKDSRKNRIGKNAEADAKRTHADHLAEVDVVDRAGERLQDVAEHHGHEEKQKRLPQRLIGSHRPHNTPNQFCLFAEAFINNTISPSLAPGLHVSIGCYWTISISQSLSPSATQLAPAGASQTLTPLERDVLAIHGDPEEHHGRK